LPRFAAFVSQHNRQVGRVSSAYHRISFASGEKVI